MFEGEDGDAGGDDPSEERGIDIMLNHNLQVCLELAHEHYLELAYV